MNSFVCKLIRQGELYSTGYRNYSPGSDAVSVLLEAVLFCYTTMFAVGSSNQLQNAHWFARTASCLQTIQALKRIHLQSHQQRNNVVRPSSLCWSSLGSTTFQRNMMQQSNSSADIFNTTDPETIYSLVQNVFSTTKCYDIMQNSSKATVFETTIPFQLAFFALVEHDTDTAPLWDPEQRQFVGLMTLSDYIHALRVWRAQGLPTSDLTSKNIAEMMHSAGVLFRHAEFLAVDAEDSVHQMCLLLLRTENDYVPVVDADNGNLVSILGFLDVVALLHQAGQQYPNLFARSIRDANIGTLSNIITAPKSARLWEVLDVLEQKNLSGLPVVDEQNKVVGFYHRSDVSFIIKATDTDMVLNNLSTYKVEEALALREQLLQAGDIMSPFQSLALCRQQDTIGQVLAVMVRNRSCRVTVVNDAQQCVGVISIRDIARHYLSGQLGY